MVFGINPKDSEKGASGGDGEVQEMEEFAASQNPGPLVFDNDSSSFLGAGGSMGITLNTVLAFLAILIILIILFVWMTKPHYAESCYDMVKRALLGEDSSSISVDAEGFYGEGSALAVNETKGSSKRGLFKVHKNDEPEVVLLKENFRRNALDKVGWNDYLAKQNVDDQLRSNHRDFVYHQNMLRTRGGTASNAAIFSPSDAVPWVGLRRPQYHVAFRPGARYVPSVDATQLPAPNRGDTIGI